MKCHKCGNEYHAHDIHCFQDKEDVYDFKYRIRLLEFSKKDGKISNKLFSVAMSAMERKETITITECAECGEILNITPTGKIMAEVIEATPSTKRKKGTKNIEVKPMKRRGRPKKI